MQWWVEERWRLSYSGICSEEWKEMGADVERLSSSSDWTHD
jgi:hypothetical protein